MNAPTDRETELAGALAALRLRLNRAAENAGRKVEEIELLPITKFFPATDIAILFELGCREFGEAREQEAAGKVAEIPTLVSGPAADVRWHMVGQIQRNKAKAIAGWAHTAHSVSTAKVVSALDRGAAQALADGGRTEPLHIYIQLSLDGDTARGGVDVNDRAAVDTICAQVADAQALELIGVMGVPPLGVDPERAFARFADEHRRVMGDHPQATGLSAGMSGDMELAVKHGSTCVRVGTALMGTRPLTSPGVVTPVTSSSQVPNFQG
ncbi:YggS family pyridoxal phosphate-dependent enzyme [Mycolicibacterium komossense]|uniref:Pyridoxal phosphate homeostasis protein n=1 Tax=Mycolicibacterium komossense TaxID=1779 RepID=A0ABT3C6L4_9MYCO|nr:YggS family pyridoxal phosphate-dependent enzyme [Mycolicibacterium komossense]MCV7225098.1 YggS family pyridoxal phosphate-dependent enzyme [Mycolicibacterium komossense]